MGAQRRVLTRRVVIQLLIFIVLVPLLPLLISGRWNWPEAWVYAAANIGGFAVSRALAARRHPDLIAERARWLQHEDAKAWDRWLAPSAALAGVGIPLIAGLDELLRWSPGFSIPVKGFSLLVFVAGSVLASCALIENRFFSGMVRIQTDRGHHVVSGGPYRWIRHPGYAGALLAFWSSAVLLDSWWAFLPAIVTTVLLVIRTQLEDTTLQAELPGYGDYARRVRFRLVPGVW
ncbi:MAG TPA: isoprenylcysteine carboxylmethyltransferase family protein [Anaerolineales bacterium]|nr:isoprenylcysteine carboxylmethyltransferase family protein [Anaerolineales bacterium]